MARSTQWTPEQIDQLKKLATSGVSAPRASVIMKRSITSVRGKANQVGTPFRTILDTRANHATKYQAAISERDLIERRLEAIAYMKRVVAKSAHR